MKRAREGGIGATGLPLLLALLGGFVVMGCPSPNPSGNDAPIASASGPNQKMPVKKFKLLIADTQGNTFALDDATLWVPDTSITGTEAGKDIDTFFAKNPERKDLFKVPFEDIYRIDLDTKRMDFARLPVRVSLRNQRLVLDNDEVVLPNFQVRGIHRDLKLPCRLKVRELRSIVFLGLEADLPSVLAALGSESIAAVGTG